MEIMILLQWQYIVALFLFSSSFGWSPKQFYADIH